MKKVKVKVNYAGIGKLLNSQGVQDMLLSETSSRAPEGYAVSVQPGKKRASARISAETNEAIRDNYQNNTLRKAIDG